MTLLRSLRRGLFGKLLILVLLPLLLFGAAKGYMYLQAKHGIDQVADILAEKVELTYGGVETSFSGDVVYTDLNLRWGASARRMQIGRLMLRDLPIAELIGFGDKLPGDPDFRPPSRMRVLVRDVVVAPDFLDDMLPVEMRLKNDPCSSSGFPDEAFLKGIGFTELRGNAEFSFSLDEDAKELHFAVESEVEGAERVRFELSLADVELDLGARKVDAVPSLAGMLLSIRIEPQYGRRAVSYCAKKLDITPAEFQRRQSQEINTRIRGSGLALGPGLQTAVNEYITHWGDLQLRVRPERPIGLMTLAGMAMGGAKEHLNKLLALELVVNDALITDTGFQLIAPTDEQVPTLAEMLGRAPSTRKRREQRKVAPKFERRFVSVAATELPRYQGYEVRIHSLNKPVREGWLMSTNDAEVTVEQRVHGGHFTVYISRNQITKVEVRKRVSLRKAG